MRFRKSIKLMPGVKINVSSKGGSTTVGGKGASVNIGKKGAYLNTSIPGTGLTSRSKLYTRSKRAPRQSNQSTVHPGSYLILTVFMVFITMASFTAKWWIGIIVSIPTIWLMEKTINAFDKRE